MSTPSEFVRLWTRHQAEVRRYVFMMVPRERDAAEVLQEVSVSLWKKFEEYDESRPFVAWAIRFAYVEVLRWRQRQGRERLIFSDELVRALDVQYEKESPFLEARRGALRGCMEKLGKKERQWVELRYGAHGAVKGEAGGDEKVLRKVYYALEKIRTRLLGCIERQLQQEGWGDA